MFVRGKWKQGLTAVLCAAMLVGSLATDALTVQADTGDGSEHVTCTCATLCTDDAIDTDCPVCGAEEADIASVCTGKTQSDDSNGDKDEPTTGTPKGDEDEATCNCSTKCTEEDVNNACEVCKDDYALCTCSEEGGTDPSDPMPVDATEKDASQIMKDVTFGPKSKEFTDSNGRKGLVADEWGDDVARNASGVLVFHYELSNNNIPAPGEVWSMEIKGPVVATDNRPVSITANGVQVAEACVQTLSDQSGVKVSITYNQNATSANLQTGIPGYFELGASFNGDEIGNNGKQKITLDMPGALTDWSQDVNFAVTMPVPSLSFSKTKETSTLPSDNTDDATKGIIEWILTAKVKEDNLPTSDGTQTVDVVITDTLPAGLTFVSAIDENGNVISDENITKDPESAGEGTAQKITLKKTSVPLSGTEQTVTFKVKTSYDASALTAGGSEVKWTNKAEATVDFPKYEVVNGTLTKTDGKDTQTKESSAEEKITTASLDKSRVLATGSERVTGRFVVKWSITADSSVYDKLAVTDTLGVGHKYLIDDNHPITVEKVVGETRTSEHTYSYTEITESSSAAGTINDSDRGSWKVILDGTKGTVENGTSKADGTSTKASIYLGSDKGKKIITYYTVMDTSHTTGTLNNTANLYGGPGPGSLQYKTANIDPGTALFKKEYLQYDPSTQNIDWQITLTNNGYFTAYGDNVELTDTFGTTIQQNLVTDVDNKKLKVTVYSSDSDKTGTSYVLGTDNKLWIDGTQTWLGTYAKTEANGKETGFTLTLSTGTLSTFTKVVVTYTTKMASSDIAKWINVNNDSVTVSNDVKAGNNMSGSDSGHPHTPVLAKATSGNYNKSARTQTWQITVNESHMRLENPVVTDQLKVKDGDGVSFGPNDWRYLEDQLTVKSITKAGVETTMTKVDVSSSTLEANQYSVSWSNNIETSNTAYPKMVINLPSTMEGGVKYVITYTTKLTNGKSLADDTVKAIANSAQLASAKDGHLFTTSKDSSISVSKGLVSKSMETQQIGSDMALTWKITVNDRRADLTEMADADGHITLSDTLQEGLDYIASKTVIKALDEEDVTKQTVSYKTSGTPTTGSPVVTYDSATRVFKVQFLPEDLDGKSYTVELQTRLRSTASGVEYSNSASLSGKAGSSYSSGNPVKYRTAFRKGFTFSCDDDTGAILVTKIDSSEAKTMLAGATYKLYGPRADDGTYPESAYTSGTTVSAENKVSIAGVTSAGDADVNKISLAFPNLPYGTYKLVEESAPDGYDEDSAQYVFTLNANNRYAGITSINYTKEENKKINVEISKTTLVDGSGELPGAKLTVTALGTNADLSSVEVKDTTTKPSDYTTAAKKISWTSGTSSVTLKDLPAGEYELTETTAPQGYASAEKIKFRVYGGKVGIWNETAQKYVEQREAKVVMRDAVLSATFSKTAVAGSSELPGARIRITANEGTNVDLSKVVVKERTKVTDETYKTDATKYAADTTYIEWLSGLTAVTMEQLPAGEYTLTEITAPQGYAVAESKEFKVIADRDSKKQIQVKNESGEYVAATDSKVTMEDKPLKDIKISKVAAGGSKELPGAEMALYEGTYLKGDPKLENLLVVKWISGDKENKDIDLTKGRFDDETGQFIVNGSALKSAQDYTLVEIAAPNGYYVATNITFHIDAEGNITDVSTNASSLTDTSDDKRMIVMADNAIPEGGSAGGEEHEATVVVYKGKASVSKVWNDNDNAAGKRPSSVTVQLYRNGEAYGQAIELNAGNEWYHQWTGLNSASQWTVKEVSTVDGYECSYLTGSSENSVIVLNTYTAITPDEGTNADDGTGEIAGNGELSDNGLGGTGDNSNMMLYLVIMLAAAGTLVTYVTVRRKRQNF